MNVSKQANKQILTSFWGWGRKKDNCTPTKIMTLAQILGKPFMKFRKIHEKESPFVVWRDECVAFPLLYSISRIFGNLNTNTLVPVLFSLCQFLHPQNLFLFAYWFVLIMYLIGLAQTLGNPLLKFPKIHEKENECNIGIYKAGIILY